MADLEQHFVLRVQNPALAERLRGWLREQASIDGAVKLLFEQAHQRHGVLEVDGQQHTVILQDLPTVVESYKTLDDANLVKVADIGQVLLVVDPDLPPPTSYDSPDGVTPPMRKARARHFRPPITLPEANMRAAVDDVVEILSGRAPDGYTFHDVEEEWVVDSSGSGHWRAVKPSKAPRGGGAAAAAAEPAPGGTRGAPRAAKAKARGRAAGSDDDDEADYITDSD
ncbi:TAF7 [Scenedesmus sp. PABB004]|nr:TAF7 [Scenedesmus sp. PABB004]